MSYLTPRFLTVFVLALCSAFLHAQDRDLQSEIDRLGSPDAWRRAAAVQRIANWKGDIGGDLRVAYAIAHPVERGGLFAATEARKDTALVRQAAEALADEDLRLSVPASSYLLSLPITALEVNESELSEAQQAAWREHLEFRLRRDVAAMLVDAYVKPGKFFGQFDSLRRHDAEGLERELLAMAGADPAFAEPLSLAAETRMEDGIDPSRLFSPSWRLLLEGAGSLNPAMKFYATGKAGPEDARPPVQAALTVVMDLRATAIRALSHSDSAGEHADKLIELYRAADSLESPPALRNATDPENLKTELEVALAQAGQPELLDARIGRLRQHIERTRQAADNLNLRAATRPDLMAQNQIAQLLLRAGDAEAAEAEWTSAISEAIRQMRDNTGRSRVALVSYLGAGLYNLACAQSLQLKLSRSLESLKAAVEYGYKDFAWMLEDGDLAYLRRSPAFEEWFRRVAPPAVVDRLDTEPGSAE